MKAIVLAAGYATRLFPLTENFPKHLISIAGKTILDHLMEKMLELPVENFVLITNNKYFWYFEKWLEESDYDVDIQIINDQTISNEDKLGAVWDIQYTIEKAELDDDLFVVCADNLFDFNLKDSYESFMKTWKSTLVAYDVQDIEKAKRLGIIDIDENNKITHFVEKPIDPPSTLASAGIYFYPKNVVPLIKQYLDDWNNPDSPWMFPSRLFEREDIYAHVYTENWYDVGTFDNLKDAKEFFGEEEVDIEALKEWKI